MKRTHGLSLAALSLTLAAGPFAARAQEGGDALARLRAFVAPIQAAAEKAIAEELRKAKAALPAVVQKDVVVPALEYGLERALPFNEHGQRMIRAKVDRLVIGAEASNKRLLAYGKILEALLNKKGASAVALGAAIDKLEAAVKRVSAFDAAAALTALAPRASRRAVALGRGRIAPLVGQAVSALVAKLEARAEASYAKLDTVPGLRAALSGFAGGKLAEAEAALRTEAVKLAKEALAREAPPLVAKVFDAALGKGSLAARYKTVESGLRSLLGDARDRAAAIKKQYEGLAAQFAQMKLLTQPQKLVAEVRAKEKRQLAKAIVSEAKRDPIASKQKEIVALVRAEAGLEKAKAAATASAQKAEAAAIRACVGQGAKCVEARVSAAQKAAEASVAAARKQLAKAAEAAQKVEVKTEGARTFAAPSAPDAPTRSPFNAKPVVVPAADKPALAEAEKDAAKELKLAQTPARKAGAQTEGLSMPKSAAQVVAALGKDAAMVKVVVPSKKGSPLLPPVLQARAGSGARGARAVLAAMTGLAKQDWKRARLGARLALVRARKAAPRAVGALGRALALATSGAQLMYVASARARLLQQKRLFGQLPSGVEKSVNGALARPATYLAGFNARARGPVGVALDVVRQALVRLTITGQRLVLSSRIFVGRARWPQVRAAMRQYFAGLARAKRGLRLAAATLNRAAAQRVAAK